MKDRQRESLVADEIMPADPRMRLFAFGIAVTMIAAGGLLAWWLAQCQLALEADEDHATVLARVVWWSDVVAWSGGVGAVAAGLWCASLGARIWKANRFPPPGMRVVRDTRVRTGAAARRMACAALIMAILLAGWGTLGMWYFREVVHVLTNP